MDTKETKEGSKVYELGFHIAPIVGEENVAHEVSEIRNLLDGIKAEVISEDFPRLVTLSYPLGKMIKGTKRSFKEAFFGWVKFEADADKVAELHAAVEKLENVLRFLLIKTVRDNTLYGPKFATKEQIKGIAKKEGVVEGPAADESQYSTLPEKEKQDLTPEELDKTIDDLVV